MTEEAAFEDFMRVRIAPWFAEQEGLVAGNTTLNVISELMSFVHYGFDGCNAILAAYDKIEFLKPVYPGDIIHAVGRIVRVGKRSRTIECEAFRIAEGPPRLGLGSIPSSARRWFDPEVVARSRATTVIAPEALDHRPTDRGTPAPTQQFDPGAAGSGPGVPDEDALFKDFVRVRIEPWFAEQEGLVAGNTTLNIISELMSFVHYGFDGFNAMLAGYDSVEFLQPVYPGDVIHAVGRITRVGNRSRTIECEGYRIAQGPPRLVGRFPSAARRLFNEPELVIRTKATMVLTREAAALKAKKDEAKANDERG